MILIIKLLYVRVYGRLRVCFLHICAGLGFMVGTCSRAIAVCAGRRSVVKKIKSSRAGVAQG